MTTPIQAAHHWTQVASVSNALDQILHQAGGNPTRMNTDDMKKLEPVLHFHAGGVPFTRKLSEKLGLHKNDRVLDIGCGIGGPALWLAANTGCSVTGIDITPAFIEAGRSIIQRMTESVYQKRVTLINGDAMALPSDLKNMTAAIAMAVTCDIPDRRIFYNNLYKALSDDGRIGFLDICTDDNRAVHFPTPWAKKAEESHLLSVQKTKEALEQSGFKNITHDDASDEALTWYEEQQKSLSDGNAISGFRSLLPDWATITETMAQNLKTKKLSFCFITAQTGAVSRLMPGL